MSKHFTFDVLYLVMLIVYLLNNNNNNNNNNNKMITTGCVTSNFVRFLVCCRELFIGNARNQQYRKYLTPLCICGVTVCSRRRPI